MATRSIIAMKNEDGTITAVYCHRDGYPDYNGRMLVENYNTKEKVQELINLGDLSVIRERVKPNKNELHTFDSPIADVTVAYYRDRGEDWEYIKPRKVNNISELESLANGCWADYIYLFEGEKWYIVDYEENLILVKDKLGQN